MVTQSYQRRDWRILTRSLFGRSAISTGATLYSPDVVIGKDATFIGTEADLLVKINDPTLVRDYTL